MSVIQFRNTRISQMNVATQEAGPVVRLHIRSDLSRPVAEKMGWEIMVDESVILHGIDGAKLKGVVSAANVKLIPNGELKNQQIEFVGGEAKDFKVVTSGGGEEEDDPPLTTELRFTLTFTPESAPRVLKYLLAVGQGSALMKVTVAKEQQMKLGEDATEEEEEAEEAPEEESASRAGGSLASVREIKATVSER